MATCFVSDGVNQCKMSLTETMCMYSFSVSSVFCCQLVIRKLLHNNKQTMAGLINISFYYSSCNH